jgi:hypothetical protein
MAIDTTRNSAAKIASIGNNGDTDIGFIEVVGRSPDLKSGEEVGLEVVRHIRIDRPYL